MMMMAAVAVDGVVLFSSAWFALVGRNEDHLREVFWGLASALSVVVPRALR